MKNFINFPNSMFLTEANIKKKYKSKAISSLKLAEKQCNEKNPTQVEHLKGTGW